MLFFCPFVGDNKNLEASDQEWDQKKLLNMRNHML